MNEAPAAPDAATAHPDIDFQVRFGLVSSTSLLAPLSKR